MDQAFSWTLPQSEPVVCNDKLQRFTFPEPLPAHILVLRSFGLLCRLGVPYLLELIYECMDSAGQTSLNLYGLLAAACLLIGISYSLELANSYTLSLYKLQVKEQLTTRIIKNSLRKHFLSSQSNSSSAEDKPKLWHKLSTTLPLYLNNYYDSLLSLIFESLSIVLITCYLYTQFSFALFFGICLSCCVLHKTLEVTRKIEGLRFDNVALRARKHSMISKFLQRVTEFKMCWLDSWLAKQFSSLDNECMQNIRKMKILDSWCVALWQLTSVSISATVITTYYLLGIDSGTMIEASTLIYLLGMVTTPLNAISWYVAGYRTAKRAIEELEERVVGNEEVEKEGWLVEEDGSIVIKEERVFEVEGVKVCWPVMELKKGRVYTINGRWAGKMLKDMVDGFATKSKVGYVEENAWLMGSLEEAVTMLSMTKRRMKMKADKIKLTENSMSASSLPNKLEILLKQFSCTNLPNNSCELYSGGEKLRVSLARAFYHSNIIIINSNLSSLDVETRENVRNSICRLVRGRCEELEEEERLTVFIVGNEEIVDAVVEVEEDRMEMEKRMRVGVRKNINFIDVRMKDVIEEGRCQQSFLDTGCRSKENREELGEDNCEESLEQRKSEELPESEESSSDLSPTLATFLSYYKYPKHLSFLFGLLSATVLSNYYSYYLSTLSLELSSLTGLTIVNILFIIVLFAVALFFRSYYFAIAHFEDSARICRQLSHNAIMSELALYTPNTNANTNTNDVVADNIADNVTDNSANNEPKNSANNAPANQQPSTQHLTAEKLLNLLNNDSEAILSDYPFSTNILVNNITVVLASLTIIICQLPLLIFPSLTLLLYTYHIGTFYNKKISKLVIESKQLEIKLCGIVRQLEEGGYYIRLYRCGGEFEKEFEEVFKEGLKGEWERSRLYGYINMRYKMMTLTLLVLAMVGFIFGESGGEERSGEWSGEKDQQARLSLLMSCILQLANYLLYLTGSVSEVCTLAVPIERGRQVITWTEQSAMRRSERARIILAGKEKGLDLEESSDRQGKCELLSLKNVNFGYRPELPILRDLNLTIFRGDKLLLRGRSGLGKTTLFKLLTSCYPENVDLSASRTTIAFSPQHPLLLPECPTVYNNIIVYNKDIPKEQIQKLLPIDLDVDAMVDTLSYEYKIIVNNVRAYLFGKDGLVVYDEPEVVISGDENEGSYIVVTHHKVFEGEEWRLEDGKVGRVGDERAKREKELV